MRKFIAIISLCLVAGFTAYSQDNSRSGTSRQAGSSDQSKKNAGSTSIDSTGKLLDEVTVTGTRRLQPSLLVPYSISSVSKETIQERLYRSTPESLTGTTGVFVQKTNHGGGSPFLRGLTGNQTLILVDGVRLNNSTFRYGPNQYFNTIDPFTINRIEVARGTGSVQYGSDAMGGVLQVLTADPRLSTGTASWSGGVAARYMTGDMEKTVRGESSYSGKNFGAIIGATYKKFGDLIGGDTTGKQGPSGYDEFSYDAKLKFALASKIGLTIAHQFLQQDQVPVYHKVKLENFGVNEFDPQRRLLTYAKLAVEGRSPLFSTVSVTASWQQHIEGRNSQKNGSNVFRLERDKVNTLGLTTDIHSQIANSWSANTGIELYSDKVNSRMEDRNLQTGVNTPKRGLYPDNARYGNYSIYSLHHLDFNKWVVEGGVRYNLFRITIRDTTLGKVTINPASFVYNASVLYKLSKAQSAYLSFNTGFRAPNVDDMGTLGIVDFRYEVPATDLKPERSGTIELGYKLQGSKWAAAIAGYYMHLENLITRIKSGTEVINGYPVYRKENVDEAYVKGIEAELAYQLTKGWNVSGNIAISKGQSLTKNEPLRRIPPVHGRVITAYRFKKWSASAELLLAGEQDRLAQGDKDDNRIPRGGTPAWEVFNMYAGYETGMLRLNLAFQNLLNEDYRTHGSGINGVGRSVAFSAAVRF